MARPFHIVDVFAERPYAGNPLAVVLNADGLTDRDMQLIAAEINFSETAFVAAGEQGGAYRVRFFTPAREIAFVGHPILGAASVIRTHVAHDRPRDIVLSTDAGSITVRFERDGEAETAWFLAPPVAAGAELASERIAAALGLAIDDLDGAAPAKQYSAGASAVVVQVRTLDALRRARLDLVRYAPCLAKGFPPLVYVFSRETRDACNHLSARFFFEAHGVREDPATGNGAAFAGAHLLDFRLLGDGDLAVSIEQGHELGRPSLIKLRARNIPEGREISVGGSVIPILEGRLS